MIASEDLTRGLATDVPRPSGRTTALPSGSSAQDRDALLRAIADALLEIRAWPPSSEIGDSSHLILETEVSGQTFYVQFRSEPRERTLFCEIASGFFGDAAAYHHNPEQGRAMSSRGFSDGIAGNFCKEIVFDAPDAAPTIAGQTLTLLGSVFGWSPDSQITAKIHHGRRASSAPVFDGLSRKDVVELLRRHGLDARPTAAGDIAPQDATVEAASRGCRFTVHFADAVEKTSRFRLIAARARVGSGIDPAATNPFNALTWCGRSWVQNGEAYVESSLRVVGVTEEALHGWLQRWAAVLATARYWYRRVELAAGQEIALQPVHFDVGFHDVHRMARCHVKPSAEEAAIGAFAEYSRTARPPSDGIDPWTFFETYAAAHPHDAAPIEEKFVASASASDIVPWLERLDGIQATVTASGALEISHAVSRGTLLVAPATVRRVALSPERFGVSATIAGADGVRDVLIGTEDFYFTPDEGHVEIEGMAFAFPNMPAAITWFETKQRLRALEREMAWAGPLGCGGAIAWVRGALAGAERSGLVCGPERERFECVLEAARRSRKASRAAAGLVEERLVTASIDAAAETVCPRAFDGYPYLVTRIGRTALRNMVVLPADWSRERLLELTRRQADANQLETCLCLGPTETLFVAREGISGGASFVPTGIPVPDGLALGEAIPETAELLARRALLAAFKQSVSSNGFLVGDGLEGGEPATDDDITRLSARGTGIPPGLNRCATCRRLRGEYLAKKGEGNGDKSLRIVTVHCACENHNRCARCREPLAESRLSAYRFNETEKKVSYAAAYMAFSHRCVASASFDDRVTPYMDEPIVTPRSPGGAPTFVRDTRYPAPDRSNLVPNEHLNDPSLREGDLGTREEVLSDGRPIHLELWWQSGASLITAFFSVLGLEEAPVERLLELVMPVLIAEGVSPRERRLSREGVKEIVDASGNRLFTLTFVVGLSG
jgi:hypothetical protein